jgi:hypothetical protein
LLFAFIGLVSRLPVPDVVKLNYYRPDFYGNPMKEIAQEAMRGPSSRAATADHGRFAP